VLSELIIILICFSLIHGVIDKRRGRFVFDLVTVGHFAIDYIHSPRIVSPKPTLGGPPTYVSVAAAKLGAKVSVISKVGEDFSNNYVKWLENNKIDLTGLKRVKGAATTQFVIEYQKGGKRKLQLRARAPPISSKDLPDFLQAKAVHVAPIANELSEEVVTKLRKATRILSLDPQGFVRGFDRKGNVNLKSWKGQSLLEQVDVYKSSLNEIQAVTRTNNLRLATRRISDFGVKTVVVTRGMLGSTILFDKTLYSIPAYSSQHVLDPTGAGDAFSGAFLTEYVRGKEVLWCACVGSASASFVVEGFGPERFGERQETYQRATEIYEKQLKK
jgi:sugar/nucleoside kinase (ribokinase family)